LKPGEMRAPTIAAMRRSHRVSWPDAVLIAKGKLSLEQAKKTKALQRAATNQGEHDLIARADIAEMWGKAASSVSYESYKPGFPTAVLVIQKRQLYFRDDVTAYIAGAAVPKRTENELRPSYLTFTEALAQSAAQLGLAPRTMWGRLPTPTIQAGGMQFWLKTDFQNWLGKEKQARANGAASR